jgi:hypothetical protein
MDIEYSEAVRAVAAGLADGGDEYAAAGSIWLALQAWKHLGAADPIWDRVGPDLLEVRDRLYADQDVRIDVEPPTDSRAARALVAALLDRLADHHLALAATAGPLPNRLAHDAGAEQLRDIATALA